MFDFMDLEFDTPAMPIAQGSYIPDAQECLRCGLCVSQCPTFRIFGVNEVTPRQRLRSISKVLVENQPLTDQERQHLDSCLQCRACEPVCPSRVSYGALFSQAQQQLASPPGILAKLGYFLLSHPAWLHHTLPVLTLYLKSGLQGPLRRSGIFKRLGLESAEALLQLPQLKRLRARYPSKTTARGRVALFTGCIAEAFDQPTLNASIRLLNAIGFEVIVPPAQGCCGAVQQHNAQDASALIANNIEVFNALEVQAVIHTATGCGAHLSEYQSSDPAASEHFRQRLYDINDFILEHWPDHLSLKPSDLSVAVHEPCSQRNILKNNANVYQLLGKIPNITLVPLAENNLCCGSGGSYMLTHPEIAEQLLDLKLQHIESANVDTVVSSNIGCALFLNSAAHKPSSIIHAVQLLAAHLPDAFD